MLNKTRPDLTDREANHVFTECATFADEACDTPIPGLDQRPWHFINSPYLDEPGTTLDDFDFTLPEINVIGALTDLTGFMKGEVRADESYYVKFVADYFDDLAEQRSLVFRFLIHYVGDIH